MSELANYIRAQLHNRPLQLRQTVLNSRIYRLTQDTQIIVVAPVFSHLTYKGLYTVPSDGYATTVRSECHKPPRLPHWQTGCVPILPSGHVPSAIAYTDPMLFNLRGRCVQVHTFRRRDVVPNGEETFSLTAYCSPINNIQLKWSAHRYIVDVFPVFL